MQHFLNLDKCDCGAYRYLAIREHKRSYEVYLIHHMHSQSTTDRRKYAKLASIPKFKLNIHAIRPNQRPETRTLNISHEQASVLRSILKEVDSATSCADVPLLADEVTETIPV